MALSQTSPNRPTPRDWFPLLSLSSEVEGSALDSASAKESALVSATEQPRQLKFPTCRVREWQRATTDSYSESSCQRRLSAATRHQRAPSSSRRQSSYIHRCRYQQRCC